MTDRHEQLKTINVAQAEGPVLDWLVAKAQDLHIKVYGGEVFVNGDLHEDSYGPAGNWEHGGPIIEREKIGVWPPDDTHPHWSAGKEGLMQATFGPTPLIAAMRCYVGSKLGASVEVPEELCAYQIAVGKLRAERKPMGPDDAVSCMFAADIVAPPNKILSLIRAVEAHHGIGEKT